MRNLEEQLIALVDAPLAPKIDGNSMKQTLGYANWALQQQNAQSDTANRIQSLLVAIDRADPGHIEGVEVARAGVNADVTRKTYIIETHIGRVELAHGLDQNRVTAELEKAGLSQDEIDTLLLMTSQWGFHRVVMNAVSSPLNPIMAAAAIAGTDQSRMSQFLSQWEAADRPNIDDLPQYTARPPSTAGVRDVQVIRVREDSISISSQLSVGTILSMHDKMRLEQAYDHGFGQMIDEEGSIKIGIDVQLKRGRALRLDTVSLSTQPQIGQEMRRTFRGRQIGAIAAALVLSGMGIGAAFTMRLVAASALTVGLAAVAAAAVVGLGQLAVGFWNRSSKEKWVPSTSITMTPDSAIVADTCSPRHSDRLPHTEEFAPEPGYTRKTRVQAMRSSQSDTSVSSESDSDGEGGAPHSTI